MEGRWIKAGGKTGDGRSEDGGGGYILIDFPKSGGTVSGPTRPKAEEPLNRRRISLDT